MLRTLNIGGEQCPADFSIMTAIKLAKEYGVDITGLQEKVANLGDLEGYLDFVAKLGAIALNQGAKREGIDKHYTVYDLYDILGDDLSIAEELVANLLDSFGGKKVFPKATENKPSPKHKAKR